MVFKTFRNCLPRLPHHVWILRIHPCALVLTGPLPGRAWHAPKFYYFILRSLGHICTISSYSYFDQCYICSHVAAWTSCQETSKQRGGFVGGGVYYCLIALFRHRWCKPPPSSILRRSWFWTRRKLGITFANTIHLTGSPPHPTQTVGGGFKRSGTKKMSAYSQRCWRFQPLVVLFQNSKRRAIAIICLPCPAPPSLISYFRFICAHGIKTWSTVVPCTAVVSLY